MGSSADSDHGSVKTSDHNPHRPRTVRETTPSSGGTVASVRATAFITTPAPVSPITITRTQPGPAA
jgi:hypothetical protein